MFPITEHSKTNVTRNLEGTVDLPDSGVVLTSNGFVDDAAAAERFSLLRSRVLKQLEPEDKVLAVTSALPAEGKSFTAANFAFACRSNPIGKVLLIDGDLRRPSSHQYFPTSNELGLAQLLEGEVSVNDAIVSASGSLDFLPAGRLIGNPVTCFENGSLGLLLSELRERYSLIVIDSPPVILCAEAAIISSLADKSLLVLRAWSGDSRLSLQALKVIGRDKVVGAVLNDSRENAVLEKYYSTYYSEAVEAPTILSATGSAKTS